MLLLQDIMYWVTGKGSLIGDVFGKYDNKKSLGENVTDVGKNAVGKITKKLPVLGPALYYGGKAVELGFDKLTEGINGITFDSNPANLYAPEGVKAEATSTPLKDPNAMNSRGGVNIGSLIIQGGGTAEENVRAFSAVTSQYQTAFG
jgi:hypothetical protein